MTKVRAVQASMFPDIQPDKPIGKILPSVFQGTNADLMAAVAPFYLTGSVCDVTYGEGKWWDRFTPDPFVKHDKFKLDGVDFTDLPEADNTYDTVCFDPPYITPDQTANAGVNAFRDRYGVRTIVRNEGPVNRADRMEALIVEGLRESVRVSRLWVLVKCMEFFKDAFHDIPHLVTTEALAAACVKHDQIVHHTGSGPGGHNIFDPKRARRHHSYLLVFKKVAS